MTRWLVGLVCAAAIGAATAACGGGSETKPAETVSPAVSVVTPTVPAETARATTAATAAAAALPPSPTALAGGSGSGAQLSDCEAAKRVRDIGQRLSGLDIRLLTSLTPASSAETKAAAVTSLDAFDASLAQFVSDLRGLNVAPEFRPLRDTYAGAYADFRQVIPDLKGAAAAGDSTRLLQRFGNGADDASARIKQYEQTNPALIARIEATTCP